MNRHPADTLLANAAHTRDYATEAERWEAVRSKDPAADGCFFYAVQTTGIYCRPSCPARLAHRKNITFYETRAAAESAGFRACRRCHPNTESIAEQRLQAVARACALIESSADMPDLQTLAQCAGLSPYYFHRVFKSSTGLTPKAYARWHRTKRMQEKLPSSTTVTEAIYSAGYNSNSRFYAESAKLLGMKPARFKKGGSGEDIHFAIAQCSLGALLVAASAKGVCAIFLGDEPEPLLQSLQDRFSRANLIGADISFERTVAQVISLVEAPQLATDLPLDVRGTAFELRVWNALQQIPAGTTASYADIARKIGSPKAVRAVAQACAANALAIAIPCHRVVRTDGTLSGYRWGVERKRRLLEQEASG